MTWLCTVCGNQDTGIVCDPSVSLYCTPKRASTCPATARTWRNCSSGKMAPAGILAAESHFLTASLEDRQGWSSALASSRPRYRPYRRLEGSESSCSVCSRRLRHAGCRAMDSTTWGCPSEVLGGFVTGLAMTRASRANKSSRKAFILVFAERCLKRLLKG